MPTNVDDLLKEFNDDVVKVSDKSGSERIHIKFLGRNGKINDLLKNIKDVPSEERKDYGAKVNNLKAQIEKILSKKNAEFTRVKKSFDFDTSLPGKKPSVGHLHPTTQVIRKINSFFRHLGYSVYEGPEIETNECNFEKLNLPKDHPARELADTLYIQEPEILLRTHTSSVEIRAMMKEKVPLRIVVPGITYRNETPNPTNNSIFFQYEGLTIDKGINMGDLKGTLIEFVKFLYGSDTKSRFRCKYYPQVEPGAGLDILCSFCNGKGCSVCKLRGYIEVLGCGMVHPNVLKSCNIDTKEYSGFAFGMGLDRLVMLQYGIEDVRKLYDGGLVFNN